MEKTSLKANASELRLRALAEKALVSVKEVLKRSRWDHNTNRVAFKCKVYCTPTVEDFKDILRKSKMTFKQYRKAIMVFNDFRVQNIIDHVLEREADGFRCFVRGNNHFSKRDVSLNIDNWLNEKVFPFPQIEAKVKSLKTQEAKRQAIFDHFQDGFDILDKLALIDDGDVLCFGRNAGWYGVALTSDFEDYLWRLEYFLKNRFDGDRILLCSDAKTRKEWSDLIVFYDNCSKEDIEKIIAHCEAVQFVITEGERRVKELDRTYFLNAIAEEMREELGEFETTTDEHVLNAWFKHKGKLRTHAGSYSYLRISKDKARVETSQGISFPIAEAKHLYSVLEQLDPSVYNDIQEKISSYGTRSFGTIGEHTEPVLIAGCHKIKWNFIKEFYHEQLAAA